VVVVCIRLSQLLQVLRISSTQADYLKHHDTMTLGAVIADALAHDPVHRLGVARTLIETLTVRSVTNAEGAQVPSTVATETAPSAPLPDAVEATLTPRHHEESATVATGLDPLLLTWNK